MALSRLRCFPRFSAPFGPRSAKNPSYVRNESKASPWRYPPVSRVFSASYVHLVFRCSASNRGKKSDTLLGVVGFACVFSRFIPGVAGLRGRKKERERKKEFNSASLHPDAHWYPSDRGGGEQRREIKRRLPASYTHRRCIGRNRSIN